MSGNSDPFSLHPFAVIASLAPGSREHAWAAVDAEPELEPERRGVHRRLVAIVSRRLNSSQAAGTGTERAF